MDERFEQSFLKPAVAGLRNNSLRSLRWSTKLSTVTSLRYILDLLVSGLLLNGLIPTSVCYLLGLAQFLDSLCEQGFAVVLAEGLGLHTGVLTKADV